MRAVLLLCLVVLPTETLSASLRKPFTGCQREKLFLAQLRRADPKKEDTNLADSKTIEGDDCGNVKTIIGKWAKSKKAGGLAGSAKAAALGAATASKNTDDAVKNSEEAGKKFDAKGEVPLSVKLAAEEATKLSKAASSASTELDTKITTFKGKMGDFAKEITDDDMADLKKATEEAIVAANDANDAADRVISKAEEAKKKNMENSEGAGKVIDVALDEHGKLSEEVAEAMQKSKHAASDVADLIKKSKEAAAKLDKKIAEADEQKPVWEALKDDLKAKEKAAEDAAKDVADSIEGVDTAKKELDGKLDALKGHKEKAQGDPKHLLGKDKDIDAAEESARKTKKAHTKLKSHVKTMMTWAEKLERGIKDVLKKFI